MIAGMSRLPADPRPERYSLHVHVDPEEDRFRGDVRIDLAVRCSDFLVGTVL